MRWKFRRLSSCLSGATANTDNNNLVTIPFNNTDLLAHVDEQGNKWVAVRPICEGMGMDWSGQVKKLNNNPKFSCGDMSTTGSDSKTYKMKALPIKQVNTWLSEINASRCKESIRPAILQYQAECMDVLYSYWNEGAAVNMHKVEEKVESGESEKSSYWNTVSLRSNRKIYIMYNLKISLRCT